MPIDQTSLPQKWTCFFKIQIHHRPCQFARIMPPGMIHIHQIRCVTPCNPTAARFRISPIVLHAARFPSNRLLMTIRSKCSLPEVLFQYLDMIFTAQVVCFAGLGGNVANVEFIGSAGKQRCHQVGHQQVGEDAGIQASWSNQYEISRSESPGWSAGSQPDYPVPAKLGGSCPVAVGIWLSPCISSFTVFIRQSPYLPPSLTSCSVEGSTCPFTASTRPDSATASSKLPVISVSAVISRLPSE